MISFASIWGCEKSGKTSLALTWPEPITYFEFDVGGFRRAGWRFKDKEIVLKSYPQPRDVLLKTDPTRLRGVKESWKGFLKDYFAFLDDPKMQTGICDSSSQMWRLCHRGYLQEVQEKSPRKGRVQLQPKEYGTPNQRMQGLVDAARGAGKRLVWVHYEGDVYGLRQTSQGLQEVKTGEKVPDGWGNTVAFADMVFHTMAKEVEGKLEFWCEVTKSGLHPGLHGIEMQNPTYDGIVMRLKALRGEE